MTNQHRIGSRQSERKLVHAPADARAGFSRMRVQVVDLSATGVRLRTYDRLPVGKRFWIKLAGLEAQECEVIWECDFDSGCRFLRPLDAAVFREIVNAGRLQPPNARHFAYV
ncbi:PilZ domain-containing protein [Novosphingobium tardum]|uniref:PilZ domain-containing protein n=1 Tax=Novosphingobium tardum TaxID=1538021 RepID=A0ABV8RUJ0_9SPHN